MFNADDYSRENLAALIFQVLRKFSAEHDEHRVNAYKSLRDVIIKNTLEECKKLMPQGSDLQWRNAMNYLAQH